MQISLPGFIRQMIYVAWSENVTAGLSRLYIAFLGKDFLNFYLRNSIIRFKKMYLYVES